MIRQSREFYEQAYLGTRYSSPLQSEEHSYYQYLHEFIQRYDLHNKKCLEIGTGRGAFREIVDDFTGIDVAFSASKYVDGKKFVVGSAVNLPFSCEVFDGVWTITVFEHILEPELAMEEMWRVLKPEGYIFFAPAWHCRSWAAEGYPVRPYADFNWKGKFIKALIPIRNNILYRSVPVFLQRINQLVMLLIDDEPSQFTYKQLTPNYDYFWMSDSDAVNSIDPFAAYVWFSSRGGVCLNYPTLRQAFFIRHGPLIFQKTGVKD